MTKKYEFKSVIFDNDYTFTFRDMFESEDTKEEIITKMKKELNECHEEEYGACVITCALLLHDNGWLEEELKKEALFQLKSDDFVTENIEEKAVNEITKKLNSKQPKDKGNIYYKKADPKFEFNIGDIFTVEVTDELTTVKEIVGKTVAFIVVDEYVRNNKRHPVFMAKLIELNEQNNIDSIKEEKFMYISKWKFSDYKALPFAKISDDEIDNGWLKVYRFTLFLDGEILRQKMMLLGNYGEINFPKKEFISENKIPVIPSTEYIIDDIGNSYLKEKL